MLQRITLAVNYLFLLILFVLAGSNAPTAVVLAGYRAICPCVRAGHAECPLISRHHRIQDTGRDADARRNPRRTRHHSI